jgi:predicted metal-binding membrane protein
MLQRDRLVALASLFGLSALAWIYLWVEARHMSMDMGHALPATPWDVKLFGLTFLMWGVMMVGMMLPSAAPAILLYASMVKKNREASSVIPATWMFISGYLAVWVGFSVLATVLQSILQHLLLLTPRLASASSRLTGLLLIIAGLYQWLPFKDTCLQKCRSPLQHFLFRWRPGAAGAFAMGAEHGAFCVGCCWAIMLLLFAAGVMNFVWIVAIAGFVLLEKVFSAGSFVQRISGGVLLGAGALMLLS